MNFHAIYDRVIILPEAVKEITNNGIIIPENAQKPSSFGKIISFGPKCEYVKEGDRVRYNPLECSKMEVEGIVYDICLEPCIMAIEYENIKINPYDMIELI